MSGKTIYQFRLNGVTEYYVSGNKKLGELEKSAFEAGQSKGAKKGVMSDLGKKRVKTILEVWAMCMQRDPFYLTFGFPTQLYFTTLTLPAETDACPSTLYRICFYNFLKWLKRNLKLTFYVWKMELQENGRPHYHFISNGNFEPKILREKWNHYLEKMGLVSKYRDMNLEKHACGMGYDLNFIAKFGFQKCKEWYEYGNATGWTNPRTVHVEKIDNPEKVALYLGKYVGKSLHEHVEGCRVWGCSDNVRKVEYPKFEYAKKSYNTLESIIRNSKKTHVINSYSSYYVTDIGYWLRDLYGENLRKMKNELSKISACYT